MDILEVYLFSEIKEKFIILLLIFNNISYHDNDKLLDGHDKSLKINRFFIDKCLFNIIFIHKVIL